MGYCEPLMYESAYCERLKSFIITNMQWIQDQIENNPNSPYWYQVQWAGLKKIPYTTSFFKGQKSDFVLSVSSSGASGIAAAQRFGGQLQWSAVFANRVILSQPIWLPVSSYLLFCIIQTCFTLFCWDFKLSLAVAQTDFSKWAETLRTWNRLWINPVKPDPLALAPALHWLSFCLTIRNCWCHMTPGTPTRPCCA